MVAPTSIYSHDGRYWKYTPSSDVLAGDVVIIKDDTAIGMIGVAVKDIAADAQGSLCVEGVVEFDLTATQTPAKGDVIYWVSGTKKMSVTASTNCLAGRVEEISSAGRVRVAINTVQFYIAP